MNITQRGNPKPIIRNPGCSSLQCVSKSLFICFVDFLVRTASTRSNTKTVSQTEHIHSIGLFVSSLKTVAVRTGMAIVSHRPVQDARQWISAAPRKIMNIYMNTKKKVITNVYEHIAASSQ